MVVRGDRQIHEVAEGSRRRQGQLKLSAQIHQGPGGKIWHPEQNHHRQRDQIHQCVFWGLLQRHGHQAVLHLCCSTTKQRPGGEGQRRNPQRLEDQDVGRAEEAWLWVG